MLTHTQQTTRLHQRVEQPLTAVCNATTRASLLRRYLLNGRLISRLGCCLLRSLGCCLLRSLGCCLLRSLGCRLLHSLGCCLLRSLGCCLLRSLGCCLLRSLGCCLLRSLGCCLLHSLGCRLLRSLGCCLLRSLGCRLLRSLGCCLLHSLGCRLLRSGPGGRVGHVFLAWRLSAHLRGGTGTVGNSNVDGTSRRTGNRNWGVQRGVRSCFQRGVQKGVCNEKEKHRSAAVIIIDLKRYKC
uniref:Uncharacterized protein n=1 Tax=Trypanosoma vivax (strain Y486) TaxID=1055687 RepID=G0UA62_TRYVY|nr:hypothetical protein, conserved in T. vivax [Trypanosoma vivax Y486]